MGVITDIISAADAAELAPGFEVADSAGIAYEPYSGHADASGTAYAYATRARSEGVTIRLQTPAAAIETSEDGSRVMAVRTAGGERIETGIAVVATGPWTARFCAPRHRSAPAGNAPGGAALPPAPGRGAVPSGRRRHRQSHLFPARGAGPDRGRNGNHSDCVGGTRKCDSSPQRASPSFIADVWQRLARRIPRHRRRRTGRGYAGLYTNTPDSHPIMDRVDGVDGSTCARVSAATASCCRPWWVC